MRIVLFSIILLFFTLSPCLGLALDIKDTDLSGSWYSSNGLILSNQIKKYLNKAQPKPIEGEIIAIISPHAGLKYSGPVAAYSFKAVKEKKVDTIILVGFSHRKNYDAIALLNKDGIKTPLGIIYSDKELIGKLIDAHKKIIDEPDVFEGENSLELILPFIQISFPEAKIVPIAIGRQSLANCQILGTSLYEILKERENFLIVASTDMSHYLSCQQAKAMDEETANLIKQMEPEKLFLASGGENRMCGTGAVVATMIAAKKLGAEKATILNLGTSGDTSRDKTRVVGYLSAAFIKTNKKNLTENEKMQEKQLLTQEQKNKLLKLARQTISVYLESGKTLEVKESDPVLNQAMGAFVTLHKHGQLRGCIGNIIGRKPLYLTVRDMAIAAATQDPRFNPVGKDELGDIHIEISALSPLKKITNPDEIILGKHGVLVKNLFRSGVYLPQVATETGWTKEQFMNSLCASKAGMAADAWKKGQCEIHIFSAEVFGE